MNRQKRSKKKAPVPLTADMLNELNKNHMGGFENYGHEELYIEDTWDDVKPDFKPKVSKLCRLNDGNGDELILMQFYRFVAAFCQFKQRS